MLSCCAQEKDDSESTFRVFLMIVNLWLAIRDDAQAQLLTRLTWDEESQGDYSGPVSNRHFKLFRAMADRANVQRLFRVDTDGVNDWTLWSVYFDFKVSVLLKIQDELDDLIVDYPDHVRIGGAWHFDGRQVGTQFTYDADGDITGVTGLPTYPLHARLIELMPDVDDIGTRPTESSDVNLLLGQKERRFG